MNKIYNKIMLSQLDFNSLENNSIFNFVLGLLLSVIDFIGLSFIRNKEITDAFEIYIVICIVTVIICYIMYINVFKSNNIFVILATTSFCYAAVTLNPFLITLGLDIFAAGIMLMLGKFVFDIIQARKAKKLKEMLE